MAFGLLLFGGMYFVIFSVSSVLIRDKQIASEAVLNVYKQQIEDIAAGKYWARISNISNIYEEYLTRWSENAIEKIPALWIHDVLPERTDDVSPDVTYLMIGDVNLSKEDIAESETNGRKTHFLDIDIGGDITAAAFSGNGQVAVIGGRSGAVFLNSNIGDDPTENGEDAWSKVDTTGFGDFEELTAAALSDDGKIGVIVGDKGTVSWINFASDTRPTENLGNDIGSSVTTAAPSGIGSSVTAAALSGNGQVAVIGGRSGAVFLNSNIGDDPTENGEDAWRKIDTGFGVSERLSEAALSDDGKIGLIVGDEGTAFWINFASDTRLTTQLTEKFGNNIIGSHGGSSVTAVALSGDGQVAVIGGVFGVVFLNSNIGDNPTENGEDAWRKIDTGFVGAAEWPVAAALSDNGKIGVIVGHRGTTFWINFASDTRLTTRPTENLDNLFGSRGIAAALSHDGEIGVSGQIRVAAYGTAGTAGLIKLTTNDGESWNYVSGEVLQQGLAAGAFGENGKIGAIGDRFGGVFLTTDGGKNWSPQTLYFGRDERMDVAAFNNELEFAIIGGDEGSIFVTKIPSTDANNGSWKWNSTTGDLPGRIEGIRRLYFYPYESNETQKSNVRDQDQSSSSGQSKAYAVIAETHEWNHYALINVPELVSAEKTYTPRLYQLILEDPIMKNAEIVDEIERRVSAANASSEGQVNFLLADEISPLLTRIVVVMILLFAAQHLIRLAQYNLRLAAFWDSRADALLLFRNFASRRSETFNQLVDSLAPDEYDFKHTRRTLGINPDAPGRSR